MASFVRATFTPVGPFGAVGGAWWPRSRNLQVELRELFPRLERRYGLVDELHLCRADWDAHPTQTWNGVPVTWDPDPHQPRFVARCRRGLRVALRLIPADTEQYSACRELTAAAAGVVVPDRRLLTRTAVDVTQRPLRHVDEPARRRSADEQLPVRPVATQYGQATGTC
ncbi:DUF5994 family protein [Actinocatenispora rupis]|uniref:Uncharacterized protein n=1 Tax=Actinocatenispora rupis TaxID=519421 RepID=A0A8J3NCA6_9ACTN|nr:DUF5994 family protein [Actinocatenispora rupis]GID14164.1 hypothetical protein Aru02nite_50530 [Actinocatenispora rupis]